MTTAPDSVVVAAHAISADDAQDARRWRAFVATLDASNRLLITRFIDAGLVLEESYATPRR